MKKYVFAFLLFKAVSNGEVVYDVIDSYKSLLDMVTK